MATRANSIAASAFHVGQLVECIDDELPTNLDLETTIPDLNGLTRGRIYTVRWAGRFTRNDGDTHFGVRLNEIVRPEDDVPYLAGRFRPVDDSRLDVFRKALVRKPEVV